MQGVVQVSESYRSKPGDAPLPELFTSAQWQRLAVQFRLTPRQQQVAQLICQGYQHTQIAKLLEVSPHTVRMHARAVFATLGVRSRVGLVVRLVLAARH